MGKNKSIKKLSFFEISAKLVGQNYNLGGVDCFSIVLQYMDILKLKYPNLLTSIRV